MRATVVGAGMCCATLRIRSGIRNNGPTSVHVIGKRQSYRYVAVHGCVHRVACHSAGGRRCAFNLPNRCVGKCGNCYFCSVAAGTCSRGCAFRFQSGFLCDFPTAVTVFSFGKNNRYRSVNGCVHRFSVFVMRCGRCLYRPDGSVRQHRNSCRFRFSAFAGAFCFTRCSRRGVGSQRPFAPFVLMFTSSGENKYEDQKKRQHY